ncbi:DUF4097 family beta strand repeat-containing protein [Ferrimonas sp. YFM]|uniref:DUF4097 family beta strand repeat-containing protein n=1 Tax=Ferrimonas sp. YFM TaxID=3028878 RepID=UPI002573F5F8|nr:DUF4097 family beta strand repeat-containing protein [Ferrimonas sp. YFM]BDY03706.1 hypothetical protein F0521_07470 [Ferrimonas sp. YFM]
MRTLLLMLTLTALPAWSATQTITLSHDTQGITKLLVFAGDGDLTVTGVKGLKEVEARLTYRYPGSAKEAQRHLRTLMDTYLKADGKKLTLKAGYQKQIPAKQHQASIDLEIRMPQSLFLDLRDGGGDIRITGVRKGGRVIDGPGEIVLQNTKGKFTLNDGSGDIQVKNCQSKLKINDNQGEILVENHDGSLALNDQSGAIVTRNIQGQVRISDGSGNITLNRVEGKVKITNKSGDTDLANIRGKVTLKDGKGDIRVRDLRGDLTLTSDRGGRVETSGISGSVTGVRL